MVAPTPKVLSPYKEKDPSQKHVRMAKWIKQNGGGDIDPKHIQVVLAADGRFQKSEENQNYLSERKEQIELEKQARAERAEQRAERAAANAEAKEVRKAAAAEKNAGKSATPPVKKTATKAAPAKAAPAKKAPAAKTAPKTAPKKPTARKPAAKAGADFDSDDF